MSATVFYTIKNVEYITTKDFQLFVPSADLLPKIYSQQIANLNAISKVEFSSSGSIDPQVSGNAQRDGIACEWTCPPAYKQMCSNTQSDCTLSIKSSDILSASNFEDEI